MENYSRFRCDGLKPSSDLSAKAGTPVRCSIAGVFKPAMTHESWRSSEETLLHQIGVSTLRAWQAWQSMRILGAYHACYKPATAEKRCVARAGTTTEMMMDMP